MDGDEKHEFLKKKISEKQKLTPEDILTLTLLPLMRSKSSKGVRTIECIELADKVENSENKTECISMLYALLEKFGDEISKNKLRGVFSMTEIGKMIRDEGMQEGMQKGIREGELKGKIEGKTEGKAEILIKLLTKNSRKFLRNIQKKSRVYLRIL